MKCVPPATSRFWHECGDPADQPGSSPRCHLAPGPAVRALQKSAACRKMPLAPRHGSLTGGNSPGDTGSPRPQMVNPGRSPLCNDRPTKCPGRPNRWAGPRVYQTPPRNTRSPGWSVLDMSVKTKFHRYRDAYNDRSRAIRHRSVQDIRHHWSLVPASAAAPRSGSALDYVQPPPTDWDRVFCRVHAPRDASSTTGYTPVHRAG